MEHGKTEINRQSRKVYMTVTPPETAPSSEETRTTALAVASAVLRDVYLAGQAAEHAAESLPPATLDAIVARATDASLAPNTRRFYRAAWRLW